MTEALRNGCKIVAGLTRYSVSVTTAGARPSILLVEDNRGNVLLTQEILSLHGYPVLVARTATDGLALAREQRLALVLMDIQLPGMSGLQAIERMRADPELRDIPAIALTALVLPGDRERYLQAGTDVYLPKPVSAGTLVTTIAQLLGAHA